MIVKKYLYLSLLIEYVNVNVIIIYISPYLCLSCVFLGLKMFLYILINVINVLIFVIFTDASYKSTWSTHATSQGSQGKLFYINLFL